MRGILGGYLQVSMLELYVDSSMGNGLLFVLLVWVFIGIFSLYIAIYSYF